MNNLPKDYNNQEWLEQERQKLRTGLGNMGGLITAKGRQAAIENLYRAERDKVADDRYNQQWQYQLDRDKVNDSRYENEWSFKLDERDYGRGRDQIMDQRYEKEWDFNTQQALAQLALSRMNAQTSRMSAENAMKNTALQNLYKNWEMQGFAPEGINGVTAGTPLYDPVAARQALQEAPRKFDDYHWNYINTLATQSGIGQGSTPEQIKSFVTNLKVNEGLSFEEALQVERELMRQLPYDPRKNQRTPEQVVRDNQNMSPSDTKALQDYLKNIR